MKQEYTITVFTENKIGLLSRVVSVFTRRHINIESITSSDSSISGIYKFTIAIIETEEMVRKVSAQLDKQIDIIKSFYHLNEHIIYQEIALYKVPSAIFMGGDKTEEIIRKHNARILSIEPEYIVIEKTGHFRETQALLEELKSIGEVYEFVRSGRVAISKRMEQLNTYLNSMIEEEELL